MVCFLEHNMAKHLVWNTLAIVAGIFIGSLVNIVLVNLGPLLVPLPEGATSALWSHSRRA